MRRGDVELHRVGDQLVLTGETGQRTVTVTGSYLDGQNDYNLIADAATMDGLAGTVAPTEFELGLDAGQNVASFVTALQAKFPLSSGVYVDDRTTHNDNRTFVILYGLISTLTVLLLIYDYAFGNSLGGDYGSATALSLMLAAFLALFSLVYLRATRSWSAQ